MAIKDIPEAQRVLKTTWLDTYKGLLSPKTIKVAMKEWHAEESLKEQAQDLKVFFAVYKERERILGLVTARQIDGETLQIYRLYVLPDEQRRGIGKKLFQAAIDHFPQAKKVRLEIEEANKKAIAFYEKQGFKGVERRELEVGKQKIPVGFETRIKPVVEFKGKFYWKNFRCPKCKRRISKKFQSPPIKKANCDVDLTVDAIQYSQTFDTLLLFSGDGDFSYLVDYLKQKKKKTIVFSSRESCARKLRQTAFAFVEINQLRTQLELKKEINKSIKKKWPV